MPNPHIQKYLAEVQSQLATGIAKEHAYRPALKNLLTALFPKIKAVNDAKKIDVGAPDFHLLSGETPVGYIEAKDIGLDLDDKSTQAQTKRYVDGLANVVLTDYLEFRWYLIDTKKPVHTVVLAELKGKKVIPIDGRDEQLLTLLTQFVTNEDARTVKSAKELAKRMANLAKIIRDIISAALKINDESTQLHETMKSFKDVLLHDLDDEKFADMYAQTICYGMFAARVNHNIGKSKFERKTAGYDLPKTNTFLRQLFNTIAGPELDERVIWAVDDLANLLHHADMEGILKDFGKRTRQEDPVVHFYETFLAQYDPKLRESRGVYYTPEPVVSYIVRSVDHILKTDFGLEKGLADSSKIKSPVNKEEEIHKLLILDPACGTGTFLHGVIDQIYEHFKDNKGAWSSYVTAHLLPRIFGFELLMAPYAVAHLKLGLQLKEFGYDFKSEERLRVFLTNTLEEVFTLKAEDKASVAKWLSNEATAANEIKRDLPIMVVLGNPPYSNFGMLNKGDWILNLLEDYKKGLDETKINLDDDFIKFIKFGQWKIQQSGFGVLGFISNNTYLDGLTHRRMRESLLESFDDIYIYNLHGSVVKKERSPDGSKDENVFDIQQGVTIGIFVKKKELSKKTQVFYKDLWGDREGKYTVLSSEDIATTKWDKLTNIERTSCLGNFYFFTPKAFDNIDEYCEGFSIKDIYLQTGPGVKTERDGITINWDEHGIKKVVNDFRTLTESEIRNKYSLEKDSRDWKVSFAKHDIVTNTGKELFTKILYRPFDIRNTWYSGKSKGFIGTPGIAIMKNMLLGKNIGLLAKRQCKLEPFSYIWCTDQLVESCTFESAYANNILFPLYLYPDTTKKDLFSEGDEDSSPSARKPNLWPEFIQEIEKRLGMKFIPDGKGNMKKTFGPEDIFHYMYAVFHSPTYRTRYAEFLKIDFPRLPLTSNIKLFADLAKLGEELVKLHLMEKSGKKLVKFPKKGSDVVEVVPSHSAALPMQGENTILRLNADQYFEGVPQEVWNFHIGGYQVAHKWLKDRKSRKLSYDDIEHYGKIISALSETMRIMKEVDEVILGAGGFPMK